MATEIWRDDTRLAQFIILTVLIPFAIAVLALRFVATYRGARKPSLEDWMAVAATVFFLAHNIETMAGMACYYHHIQSAWMTDSMFAAIIILNGRKLEEHIADSPARYKLVRQVCAPNMQMSTGRL